MKKIVLFYLVINTFCLSKTLRVAVNPRLPPFEFKYNGNIVGFGVDIIKVVSEQLNYDKVEFIETLNLDLIPDLNKYKFDIICCSFVVTKNREELVLFTEPYFEEYLSVVVKKDSPIRHIKDLDGKKIGIVVEGVAFNYIKKHVKNSHLLAVSNENTLYNLLFNDRVDAIVESTLSTKYFFLSNQSKIENRFNVIDLDIDETIQIAFAVGKKNKELQEKLNSELKKIKKDGTYNTIYDKWFFN